MIQFYCGPLLSVEVKIAHVRAQGSDPDTGPAQRFSREPVQRINPNQIDAGYKGEEEAGPRRSDTEFPRDPGIFHGHENLAPYRNNKQSPQEQDRPGGFGGRLPEAF